jgi:hypothetical protein
MSVYNNKLWISAVESMESAIKYIPFSENRQFDNINVYYYSDNARCSYRLADAIKTAMCVYSVSREPQYLNVCDDDTSVFIVDECWSFDDVMVATLELESKCEIVATYQIQYRAY